MGERGPSALLAFKTQISTTTLIILPRLELSERFMNNPGLTHHCEIFEMNGESYRFKESMKQKKQPRKKG